MPGKPKGMSKTRRERCRKALQLREGGASYEQIAKVTGVSLTQAYADVKDCLKEVTREPAEAVLNMELRRLDQMWLAVFPKAVGRDVDLRYLDRALRIHDRRMRLYGLDTGKGAASDDTLERLQDSFRLLEDTIVDLEA